MCYCGAGHLLPLLMVNDFYSKSKPAHSFVFREIAQFLEIVMLLLGEKGLDKRFYLLSL